MHSSRMRTVHYSGRRRGRECLLGEGSVSQHALGIHTLCEQNNWQRGVKHYLSSTSFADGNNGCHNGHVLKEPVCLHVTFFKPAVLILPTLSLLGLKIMFFIIRCGSCFLGFPSNSRYTSPEVCTVYSYLQTCKYTCKTKKRRISHPLSLSPLIRLFIKCLHQFPAGTESVLWLWIGMLRPLQDYERLQTDGRSVSLPSLVPYPDCNRSV